MVTLQTSTAPSAPSTTPTSPRPLERLHSFFVEHQSPWARALQFDTSPSNIDDEKLAALFMSLLLGLLLPFFAWGYWEFINEGEDEPLSASRGLADGLEFSLVWVVRTASIVSIRLPLVILGWILYLGIPLFGIVCLAYPVVFLYWTYSTRSVTRALYKATFDLPPSFDPFLRLADHLLPPFLLFHLVSPSSFRSLAEPYLPFIWAYLAVTSLLDISLPHLLLGFAAQVDAASAAPGPGGFCVRVEATEAQKMREELREVKEELRRVKDYAARLV
ncbi:hypothetical protein JCM10207_009189 [Rhodosporidiobolus poonsookiae]